MGVFLAIVWSSCHWDEWEC